jgi:uncharacterized protein (DUF58 family)
MPESIHDVSLIVRESQSEARKKAQQRLWQAAVSGKPYDVGDIAASRGLVLRERENSIFSDAWVFLALMFLLAGFVAGRHAPLLALGGILLLIVGVSTVWKNLALLGVAYERSFDRTRVFPGEPVKLTVTMQNDKRLPLTWLRFRDELPVSPDQDSIISQAAAELSGRHLLTYTLSMQSHEKIEREATLHFPRRGYYRLGPVTYESGDIFTLFTVERQHKYLDTLVIYPQIYPLEELGLPAKEPFGEIRVRRSLFTDPIRTQGIRDYRPQDRFRDVHWKATARRGALQTKVYDPTTGMTITVFLNVATFPKHWMGFDPELLERAVSVAASVANYAIQEGWGAGVLANGSVPNSDQPIRVLPGRSPEQLAHVLEALAAVTEFATGSIELLMLRESPRLPWVSTLVLVTAVVTEEILVALLRLKEAGRRVVLVSLAEEPPPSFGNVLTYHIPSTVPAFQSGPRSSSATEAALRRIPTPEPVQLALERVKEG